MELLVGSSGETKVPVYVYPGFPNSFVSPRGLAHGHGYVNVRKRDLRTLMPSDVDGSTVFHHRLRLAVTNAETLELPRVFAIASSLLPICDGDPSGPDTLYRVRLVDFRYFAFGAARNFLGTSSTTIDNLSSTEFQEALQIPYWSDGSVTNYTESTWIGEWSDTWFSDVLQNTVIGSSDIFSGGTTDWSLPAAEGDLVESPTTSPVNIQIRTPQDLSNLLLMLGLDINYDPVADSLSLVRLHHPDSDSDVTTYTTTQPYKRHLRDRITPDLFLPLKHPAKIHVRFVSFYEKRTKYERLSPFHTVVVDNTHDSAEFSPDNSQVTLYDFSLAEFSGDITSTSTPDNVSDLTTRADEVAAQFRENIFPATTYLYERFLNVTTGPSITEVAWIEEEIYQGDRRSIRMTTKVSVAPPKFTLTRPFPPAKYPGELTQSDIDDIDGKDAEWCNCLLECVDPTKLTVTNTINLPKSYSFTVATTGDPLWDFIDGEHVVTYNAAESTAGTTAMYLSDEFAGPCPDVPASEPDTNYYWKLVITIGDYEECEVKLYLLPSDDNPDDMATCFATGGFVNLTYCNESTFDPGCGNVFRLDRTVHARQTVAYYDDSLSCRICLVPAIKTVRIRLPSAPGKSGGNPTCGVDADEADLTDIDVPTDYEVDFPSVAVEDESNGVGTASVGDDDKYVNCTYGMCDPANDEFSDYDRNNGKILMYQDLYPGAGYGPFGDGLCVTTLGSAEVPNADPDDLPSATLSLVLSTDLPNGFMSMDGCNGGGYTYRRFLLGISSQCVENGDDDYYEYKVFFNICTSYGDGLGDWWSEWFYWTSDWMDLTELAAFIVVPMTLSYDSEAYTSMSAPDGTGLTDPELCDFSANATITVTPV